MTTSRSTRCNHCNDVYIYHPSTYGFIPQYNDDRYCPDCLKVIREALSKVKPKFEKRWVVTNDYTKEEIIDAQNKRHKNNPSSMNRMMMPLYRGNVCAIQSMSPPVGLTYALCMSYSDNEKIEDDFSIESIKDENKEYKINDVDINKNIKKDLKSFPEIKEVEIKKSSNIQNSICEQMKEPVSGKMIYYHATWWDDEPNSLEIKKEVWWNIKNNCVNLGDNDL